MAICWDCIKCQYLLFKLYSIFMVLISNMQLFWDCLNPCISSHLLIVLTSSPPFDHSIWIFWMTVSSLFYWLITKFIFFFWTFDSIDWYQDSSHLSLIHVIFFFVCFSWCSIFFLSLKYQDYQPCFPGVQPPLLVGYHSLKDQRHIVSLSQSTLSHPNMCLEIMGESMVNSLLT